jgi:hypothetical protein
VDYNFDLDPNFTDAYGQPPLRLTYDWTNADQRRYRFEVERCWDTPQ